MKSKALQREIQKFRHVKNKEEDKPRLQASRMQQPPADRVHLSAQTWFLFNHQKQSDKYELP